MSRTKSGAATVGRRGPASPDPPLGRITVGALSDPRPEARPPESAHPAQVAPERDEREPRQETTRLPAVAAQFSAVSRVYARALLQLFVKEFIIILAFAPEHHRAHERTKQGEDAQELLHRSLQSRFPGTIQV